MVRTHAKLIEKEVVGASELLLIGAKGEKGGEMAQAVGWGELEVQGMGRRGTKKEEQDVVQLFNVLWGSKRV